VVSYFGGVKRSLAKNANIPSDSTALTDLEGDVTFG